MANNKVVLGNETLIDLTSDTVTANSLLAGETAHDASGNQIEGELVVPNDASDITYDNTTSGLSATDVQDAIDEVVTDLNGKADTSSLATVATTGSYDDLGDKPTIPTALADLTDDATHRLVTDTEKSTWNSKANSSDLSALTTTVTNNNTAQNNKHKVTSTQIDTTGWTSDTTSQSGTTLYKKQISLTHVYVESPSVDIGAGTGYVLPTSAEQEAYNLIQYVTADDTVPCLYLYASEIPTTAFYIKVTGVE